MPSEQKTNAGVSDSLRLQNYRETDAAASEQPLVGMAGGRLALVSTRGRTLSNARVKKALHGNQK